MHIHWYPGHMAKARRQLADKLSLVDVVVEVADARLPLSSRNPDLAALAGDRPVLLVLTKIDMADAQKTTAWLAYHHKMGQPVLAVNLQTGAGVKAIPARLRQLAEPRLQVWREKGRRARPVRAAVVGIPNVGKSTLINRLVGRGAAQVGDRPGVTRGHQWIKIPGQVELLDTPGLLWPKLDDHAAAFRLAATGGVAETGFFSHDLVKGLVNWLWDQYPELLQKRYDLSPQAERDRTLQLIGQKRGCLLPGGAVDVSRAGLLLLTEFRQGRLGRITMDGMPPEN